MYWYSYQCFQNMDLCDFLNKCLYLVIVRFSPLCDCMIWKLLLSISVDSVVPFYISPGLCGVMCYVAEITAWPEQTFLAATVNPHRGGGHPDTQRSSCRSSSTTQKLWTGTYVRSYYNMLNIAKKHMENTLVTSIWSILRFPESRGQLVQKRKMFKVTRGLTVWVGLNYK